MSAKNFMKSGKFILLVLLLLVVLLPFAVEQIGEATGLYKFSVVQVATGLFSSDSGKSGTVQNINVNWDKQVKDLEAFSDWAGGLSDAKISVVRPDLFQIARANANPATAARFSWKLQLISDKLNVTASQVRAKLSLVCEPADSMSGRIASVKLLEDGEKGFLVTVEGVKGEGKMGLSYDRLPPVFYDVKLRRMWLVPVASCRSAMEGRYGSAVFFPGMKAGLPEGAVISPSEDKCGYRILSISDYCVWFEAFYSAEPPVDDLPHSVWPDFSRIDTQQPTPPPGRLVFGRNRCFWPNDAIRLPNTGSYLMVDDFLSGKGVVFRYLDAQMRPVSELLCVIVRER